MNKEFTIEQIRDFVKKDYPSVAARMTKCLLNFYDEKASSQPTEPPVATDDDWIKTEVSWPEVNEAEIFTVKHFDGSITREYWNLKGFINFNSLLWNYFDDVVAWKPNPKTLNLSTGE